jgi:MFS family permease
MDNKKAIGNRNFKMMTLEGSFFFFGGAFLGESTVIPIFVDNFTGSVQLLGLTITLLGIAKLLPKLLMGPYMSRIKNMEGFLKFSMLIHRPLPLIMVPVLLIVKNPVTVFWIFLIMYCFFWGINGIAAVSWSDVFARTIPGNRRGQLQGYQLFIGGIASIAAGYIIKSILDSGTLSDNNKYLIIFGIGGLMLLASALMLLPVRDVQRNIKVEKINIIKYFMTLPVYLSKNKKYKHMVITQCISKFGDVLIPFIVLLCKNNLQYDSDRLSTMVIFQVIGSMLGGILWGNISRRFGNRNVILATEITGLVISTATLICIIINPYVATFPIMYIVITLAGAKAGSWLGYGNYLLDVVGEENRIDYMTLNTIVLFPLSFASYFAGLLNEKLGFTPLVIFTVFIGITSITLATRLKSVKHIH